MAIDYIPYIRKKVGHDRILSIGLTALIINEKGEILFEIRKDNGLYCMPGGSIDLDETVLEGLFREVKEETGIKLNSATLFGILSGHKNSLTYPNGDVTDYVSLNFFSFVNTEEINLSSEDGESTSLLWLKEEDIPPKEKLLPGQDIILQQYHSFRDDEENKVIVD